MSTATRGPGSEALSLPDAPLGAAVGNAVTAARLAAAGVDVIIAYHSSPLRNRGLPSVSGLLPWGNANDMTLRILPEVTAAVPGRPVFATVCANDALHPAATMLAEAADLGADGVLNAPTVGLLTGPVRRALEDAGLGFQREIDLMALARAHGLRAWGYAFAPEHAKELAYSGAEAIIVHLGITRSGPVTSRAARVLAATASAARAVNPNIRVLAHGGPLSSPAAFTALCASGSQPPEIRCGFFGASVFEQASSIDQAVYGWRAAVDHSPRARGGATGRAQRAQP
jgi:predicted TIM-barrel enzyme